MGSLLIQCSANYEPLSPISFLERAAFVYETTPAIIYGNTKHSWKETHQRCLKLASSLSLTLGVSPGDTVAAVAPNIPQLYELHFGVPMAGAVLSPLNPKLDPTTLSVLLQQSEAKIVFADAEFIDTVVEALHMMTSLPNHMQQPRLVMILDHEGVNSATLPSCSPPGTLTYDEVIASGRENFKAVRPENECDPISVNYTSGSTGLPKGVVYSHRAAYLNSLAQIFRCEMRTMPVFLWTVDMFRCNGWCFTWATAALGGTNVCMRNVTGETVLRSVSLHAVTHFCGAPVLLDMIAGALPQESSIKPPKSTVMIFVAGSLPPPPVLEKVKELGFTLTHGYGMTEALGPATSVEDSDDHGGIIRRREGIHSLMMEGVDVKDPITMESVPCDGETTGEVMFRGNTLMSGYLKQGDLTRDAFLGGWFRTGDLGVKIPDGCIMMLDRAKDAVVSHGKTFSKLEVERVLMSHSMVSRAAVVDGGGSDGTPYAFVELKEDGVGAEEIIEYCRARLPSYMVPATVIFRTLPLNSTGKVQKFILRERASRGRRHL